jgi:hypothetical protein
VITTPADHITEPEPESKAAEIMYIMSIMSAAEAKKTAISKRIAKSAIVKLNTDEPWDTMKAQLLVKIDATLKPRNIDYDLYDIKFYISRVIPKPGLSLSNETDYELMVTRARKLKDFTINITVIEIGSDSDKENEGGNDEVSEKGKKKMACTLDVVSEKS